ncbi:MAG: chloride channel protein [Spirochaetes bacterium]|nr:chloride channel protein [Spirochaetota bacterium]
MSIQVRSFIKTIINKISPIYTIKWKLAWLGIVIGICTAFAALLFYKGLHLLSDFVFHLPKIYLLFFPALGALISAFLIYRFAPEAEGHGIDAVAKAFHQDNGKVPLRVSLIKAISSIFTLGCGGSGGVEGPIAQIGSGIGSTLAQKFKFDQSEVRSLMLAGSAGGIGAIFKAPLGGAFASIEVIYREDFEAPALIPAVFAAITSFFFFFFFVPGRNVLNIPVSSYGRLNEIPAYIILAILCWIVGWVFVKFFHGTKNIVNKFQIPKVLKPFLGGILVGIIGFIYPRAIGAHLTPLIEMTNQVFPLKIIVILIVLKLLSTCFTVGTGGSGGVFGPSLFIGGMLGALVYQVLHIIPYPFYIPSINALIIVGMAAFFTGVAKAPIGAMIMACEMIGSFQLLVPLLFVNVVVSILSHSYGIYVNQVEDRFHSPIYMKGIPAFILKHINITKIYKPVAEIKGFTTLEEQMSAEILLDYRNRDDIIFPIPVVNQNQELTGMITMKKINKEANQTELSQVKIKDIMYSAPHCYVDDTVLQAIITFKKYYFSRIPIIDRENKQIIGILQYQDLFGNIEAVTQ